MPPLERLLARDEHVHLATREHEVVLVGPFLRACIVLTACSYASVRVAATGALVSRQEDIGSTTTPVTMLVMIPYFLVIFCNTNPVVIGIMSYVPFSAPIAESRLSKTWHSTATTSSDRWTIS